MPSIIMLNCKWYLHRRGCSCPTYTKWPILKRSYWRGCLLPDNANLIELTWEAIKTPINNNCIIKPVTIIEAILNMDLNSIKAKLGLLGFGTLEFGTFEFQIHKYLAYSWVLAFFDPSLVVGMNATKEKLIKRFWVCW